jgi:hypothetical protein
LKSRSLFFRLTVAVLAAAGVASIVGCLGSRSYFAGRPVPPSNVLQRVLVSVQNPTPTVQGGMQIVDARYDIRGSINGKVPAFVVGAYKGALPTAILNYPEQSAGYVYNSGDGTISPINYATEQGGTAISSLPGVSSSVFATSSGQYVFAANQPAQYVTVIDRVIGAQVALNLPNVYKVSVNPSGTVALAFVQNSNYAYRFIRLQQPNGTVMAPPVYHPTNGPWPATVSPVDCQPVNLPLYCIVPVTDQNDNPVVFNRPYNTVFSSDGTTAWLLNCGPECGNSSVDPAIGQAAASVSFLNAAALNIYNFPGTTYPTPPPVPPLPTEQRRVAVPGGATMALYGNGTLYISGQQLQSDGLFEGFLSVINLTGNQVSATYPISDGTHTKMLLGDDNTMWIGSHNCQTGERTAHPGLGANGCLTFFDLSKNTAQVQPAYGDLTGLCAIIEWHKIFTAQGGQLHIYATTSYNGTTSGATGSNSGFTPGTIAGSELSNFNVTVQGTAYDVAYMDAPSNAAD